MPKKPVEPPSVSLKDTRSSVSLKDSRSSVSLKNTRSSVSFPNVAVEVTSFFFILAFTLINLTNVNFYLQKSCRFNLTEEPDLTTKCDNETMGTLFTTKINRTYRFVIFSMSLLLVVLITAWSDKAGKNRKLILKYTICGQFLQLLSSSIQSYFWFVPPEYGVISEFIGQTLFLGNIGFRIFSIMCICDVTNQDTRTTRLTLLSLIDMVCLPLGSASSGFLMRKYGFFVTYSLCLLLTCGALFSSFFIKDVSETPKKRATFCSIFDLRNIANSFKIVFQNKTNRQRWTIVVLFMVTIMVYFPLEGKNTMQRWCRYWNGFGYQPLLVEKVL